MSRVDLTPALWRAWLSLVGLTSDPGLRDRPGEMLASVLSVGSSTATGYIRRLSEKGLARRRGRELVVLLPRAGSSVEFGTGTVEAIEGNVLAALSTQGPMRERARRIMAGEKSEKDLRIEKTKALVQVFVGEAPRGRKTSRTATPDDLYFMELYTARRRRIDPEYEPSPGHRKVLGEARRRMEKHYHLSRKDWPLYLNWLFEAVRGIPGMRCAFPPVNRVGADGFLDKYVASLGRRPMDIDHAGEMLRGAGFGDVPPWVVVSLARDAASEGGAIPAGIKPRTREAVEWLLPRLNRVGYVGGEER